MIVLEFVGQDPIVCVDGEDVTTRVARIDLFKPGQAAIHLLTEDSVKQIVQGPYTVRVP